MRSFLDIVASDQTTADELGSAFRAFVKTSTNQDLPWISGDEHCAFRVEMEQALATGRREELAALLRAVARVLDAAANETGNADP